MEINTQLPKVLYRKDDNQEFDLVDGKYQIRDYEKYMFKPLRYSYALLMHTGKFTSMRKENN